jgi:glycosyltransferase involved in cell wall biosynthesis
MVKKEGVIMPAISIIVPIYNVENYLHKCINSILKQKFIDFELILINDGSTDRSGEICDQYTSQDNRVRVLHKRNGGLSDARNSGIEMAKGKYIGFVDGDDWIEPNMYHVLYNLCIDEKAEISTCQIKMWDKENESKARKYTNSIDVLDSKTAIKSLYSGKLTGFSACNKLYKIELFNDLKFPKGRIYEDAAIMYLIFDIANKIVKIDKPFYNYIYRQASITKRSFSEKRFDVVKNYQETYAYMKKKYPEMCEGLDSMFYVSLRNMVVDIISEKSFLTNYKFIRKISLIIKKNNKKFFHNNLISVQHKILAQILAWCPSLSFLLYKTRL